jgi:hypothetical protein
VYSSKAAYIRQSLQNIKSVAMKRRGGVYIKSGLVVSLA